MPPHPSELPGWALGHAAAALKICLTVPEIEQQLIAKGLPAATAGAVALAAI
jgi:hypothetical protein